VAPHVSEIKRQVLREEGATVIPVDLLMPSSWTAHPTEERWIDQFTKLRLHSLTSDNRAWIDRELVEMWWRVQGRMEGYWQGKGVAKV
jgi:hypothetical protein